jgi:predicted phosphodiesterase
VLQGDLAKEYLNKYPATPTLTLAKLMYKKHPAVFTSIHAARMRLNYYRGQNGRHSREKIATTQFFKEPGDCSPFESIPEGITYFDEWKPIYLPEEKTLVIADAHIPYHDKSVLVAAMEYGYKKGVHGILFLGDTTDFFALSRWETDPRKRNFAGEIRATKEIFAATRAGFPSAAIRVKKGNHEERYERYMQIKAPELLDVEAFNYDNVFGIHEHKIEVISDRRILKIGTLNLIHGHEFGRMISSPVNPARGLFLRGKTHALCGHFHQSSYHPEKNMNDKIVGCWSVGCACDLHPQYMPVNKWNHGFAMVERIGDRDFLVHNKTVTDGKVF